VSIGATPGRGTPYEPPLEKYKAKPHSPRMQAILLRAFGAEDHTIAVPPGHDFQTAISLTNRGEMTAVIYGEGDCRDWIVATLTEHGVTRAKVLANPPPPPAATPKPSTWPFPVSSRGYHR
jgi:hypothetical protein